MSEPTERTTDPGLPLPRLMQITAPAEFYCTVTPVDVNGRLADRNPLRALGWEANLQVSVVCQRGVIVVEARDRGLSKLTQQGYLLLPSYVRRSCGMVAGDRVMALAYPDRGSLMIYTMGLLQRIIRIHGREAGSG
jgi:hypothetical protein